MCPFGSIKLNSKMSSIRELKLSEPSLCIPEAFSNITEERFGRCWTSSAGRNRPHRHGGKGDPRRGSLPACFHPLQELEWPTHSGWGCSPANS